MERLPISRLERAASLGSSVKPLRPATHPPSSTAWPCCYLELQMKIYYISSFFTEANGVYTSIPRSKDLKKRKSLRCCFAVWVGGVGEGEGR